MPCGVVDNGVDCSVGGPDYSLNRKFGMCALQIFADSGVNYSVKTGLHLSKSNVQLFEHNNMADLEVRACVVHSN